MLERKSYTIRSRATEQEVASTCAAALMVLWEDLEWFELDLALLDADPDCADAVAALQDRRPRRLLSKELESSAHLEPGRDDDLLPMVLPLLSRTIGSTGLSRADARMIYNADDEGSSCLFELKPDQVTAVQKRLRADGISPDTLVEWQRV